ncbi:phosphoglycolate phosphatase [Archaeoglobus neptunius]|uniref:phosphoglycolate phosphatase n=1 Tax=Archaeoglobus neptunius TaxID=2798580 RepID=UPI0019252D1C|nr:phosphoglycolate phosphatase [Archaeoglobus neptunius]
MFRPHALAVDIDGTLTDRKRALNCKAVEALRRVRIPVILATGNISCFARAAAKLIGVSDIVICENGGVVRFEYDGNDIILGSKEKCIRALEILERHYEIELLDFEYRKSEICLRRTFDIDEARKMIGGMGVKLIDSGFAYHITDSEVSKGKALVYVAERLGIEPESFAVIGDSENDMEMFEVAGFGIAVANADERLREVADLVTPSNDGEGVVEALEFLGLI